MGGADRPKPDARVGGSRSGVDQKEIGCNKLEVETADLVDETYK